MDNHGLGSLTNMVRSSTPKWRFFLRGMKPCIDVHSISQSFDFCKEANIENEKESVFSEQRSSLAERFRVFRL